MSSLRMDELKIAVGNFKVEIPQLEIKEGECVCLMGPSGSGKTSLLHALAGFLPLERGTLYYGKLRLDQLPPERRRIALAFQRPALFPNLNVRENVEFGLRVKGMSAEERKRRSADWLKRFEIKALSERRPSEISEGQAQRVALARALAPGFPILLLDEPFSALDPELRTRLGEELKTIVKEKKLVLLMVTHHAEDAQRIGDRILHLESGKLRL